MLCHMLLFLSNKYELPNIAKLSSSSMSDEQRLLFLSTYKKNHSLDLMCKESRNKAHCLKKLCDYVDKLSYTTEPNYDFMRAILRGLINFEMQKNFEDNKDELKILKLARWLDDELKKAKTKGTKGDSLGDNWVNGSTGESNQVTKGKFREEKIDETNSKILIRRGSL